MLIVLFVVAFLLFKKRSKRKTKQRVLSDYQQSTIQSNNHMISSSSYSTISSPSDLLFLPDSSHKNVNNCEKLKNDTCRVEKSKKKSKMLLVNNSANRTQCLIENDYEQMYGEPPPSYKQAKYYPKVNESNLNQVSRNSQLPKMSYFEKEDLESISHIYENIDDLPYHNNRIANGNSKYQHSSSQSSKKSKFQALKKHSNLHASTRKLNKMREQSTTESIDGSSFEINTPTSQQQQQTSESNIPNQLNSIHQHQSISLNDKLELKTNNSEQFI